MALGINWRHTTLAALFAVSQALGGCAGLPSQDQKMETHDQESKFGQSMRMATSIRAGGDVATAARFYQRAHEVDPSRPEPLLGLAELASTAGATDEAFRYYEQAITVAPDNAEIKRSYGTLLLTSGRPELARYVFEDAARLDDKDYRSYNGLGISLDLLGQQEGAQRAYQKGLDAKPGSTTLKNNLALSSAISGNYDQALSILVPLATTPESGPHIRQNLALVYALQGRVDKAIAVAAKDLSRAELNNNLAFYKLLPTLSRTDLAAIVFGIGDVPAAVPEVNPSVRTAKTERRDTRTSRLAASRTSSKAVSSPERRADQTSPKSPSPNQQARTSTASRTHVRAPQPQPTDSNPAVNTQTAASTTKQDDSADSSPSLDEPGVTEDGGTDHEHEAMLIARTVGRVAPDQAENEPVPPTANTAATLAEAPSPGPEANSVLPFLPPETIISNAAAPETSSHILHSETAEDQLRVAPALTRLQPSTSPLSPEPDDIIPARLAPDFSSGRVSSNKPPSSPRSVDSRIGLGFIEPETFNDPLSRLNAGAGGLLLLELEQRASSTPPRSGDTNADDTAKPALKNSETLTLNPSTDKQIDLIRDQEPAKAQSTRPASDAMPPSAAPPNASSPLSPLTSNITGEVNASPAIQDLEPSNEKRPTLPGEAPHDMTGVAPANNAATHPSSDHTAPPPDYPLESAAPRDQEIYGPVASDQPGGPET